VQVKQQQLSLKLAIAPAAFERVKSDVVAKLAKLLGLPASRIQVTVDQGSRTNLIQTASLTLIESSMAVGTLANENVTALLVSILPTNDVDTAGLGEKAAQQLASESPTVLSAALGVPITSIARQPDILVASTAPPVRASGNDWIYILVGVVGGIVFVGAVVGAVYYQRSQRRTDAPHLPTSYKQKQAFSRQERSDSYTSDDEDTSIGHRSSKDRKKSYQYGAVGVC